MAEAVDRVPIRRRAPQARGHATRERLLDCAEELFKQHGYDGTTIGDVARRADVGVGTVYHHFGDKRAVLLALIDRWGDRVANQRRRELSGADFFERDPRGAIHAWLQSTYERLSRGPSIYLVVLALADRDDEVRQRYRRIEQLAIERLTALIEFGQRRGLMRADVEPEAAAFLVHHSLDMAVTQLLVRGRAHRDPQGVLRELAEMFCCYVLVSGADSPAKRAATRERPAAPRARRVQED